MRIQQTIAMLRVGRTFLIWLIALSVASTCAAQLATGMTAGFSSQTCPGLDQSTLGAVVFLDGVLSDRVALGGEASLATDLKFTQSQNTSGGTLDWRTRHHDTVFSGVVKIRMVDRQRVHIRPAVGLGMAWRHTGRAGTFRSFSNPANIQGVAQTLSDAVFATTVGFDATVVISPRTAFTWTARYHLLKDDDRDESGVVRRDVSSNVFRFGGGARISF
jgi:hypothetical protein